MKKTIFITILLLSFAISAKCQFIPCVSPKLYHPSFSKPLKNCECGWARGNAICKAMNNTFINGVGLQWWYYYTGCFGGKIGLGSSDVNSGNATNNVILESSQNNCDNSDVYIVRQQEKITVLENSANNVPGSWYWKSVTKGPNFIYGKNQGNGICSDRDGNVYVVGTYYGKIQFEGKMKPTNWPESSQSPIFPEANGSDVFIIKFKPDGKYDSHITIPNPGDDEGLAIALSTDDKSVYVTGYQTRSGNKCAFISKHITNDIPNPSFLKQYIFAQYPNPGDYAIGKGICFKNRVVAITGELKGKDFRYGTSLIYGLSNSGPSNENAFVFMCRDNLTRIDGQRSNVSSSSTSGSTGNSISALSEYILDPDNEDKYFYITGSFKGKMNFGNLLTNVDNSTPDPGTSVADRTEIFIAKFDYNCKCINLKNIKTTGTTNRSDVGKGIALGKIEGLGIYKKYVFVTGNFTSNNFNIVDSRSLSLDGVQNPFILRLETDLQLQKLKAISLGTYKGSGNAISCNLLTTTSANSALIHIVGNYENILDFKMNNVDVFQTYVVPFNPLVGYTGQQFSFGAVRSLYVGNTAGTDPLCPD